MKRLKSKKVLPSKQSKQLLEVLKNRFEENTNRHTSLKWAKIEQKLIENDEKIWSLNEMEQTGGEPDVVGQDKKTVLITTRSVSEGSS